MHEKGELELAGVSALEPFLKQDEWIHRRVEAVTFPARNDPIIRRRVSIDFTVPEGLADVEPDADTEPGGGGERRHYYVPVSVLRKWPPVLRMDIRDEQDEAIPLLTRDQNGLADAALLVAAADRLIDDRANAEWARIKSQLTVIATRPGDLARDALTAILPPGGPPTAMQSQLLDNDGFLDLAGGLVDNTLLWLRVRGSVGQRKIVKFSYDVARELDVAVLDGAAFGYEPLNAQIFTPHVGSSGSYHLSVTTPTPLEIIDARLVIRERAMPLHNVDEGKVLASCSSKDADDESPLELPVRTLNIYAGAVGGQARFYLSGNREGCFGQMYVAMAIRKSGFLSGAAIASVLIAALLTGYAAYFDRVVQHPERMTPVLLLVPGLLAYLVVRPNDHSLAREMLNGVRRLLLIAGLLPIVAATTLALDASANWLHPVVWGLATVSALVAAALVLGLLLPRGDSATPLSSAKGPPQISG